MDVDILKGDVITSAEINQCVVPNLMRMLDHIIERGEKVSAVGQVDLVVSAARREVCYRVVAVTSLENERIVTRAARKGVIPSTAVQRVVANATV